MQGVSRPKNRKRPVIGGIHDKPIHSTFPCAGQARQARFTEERRLRRTNVLLWQQRVRQERYGPLGHSSLHRLCLCACHRRDRGQPAAQCVRGHRQGRRQGAGTSAAASTARRTQSGDDFLYLARNDAFPSAPVGEIPMPRLSALGAMALSVCILCCPTTWRSTATAGAS